MYYYFWAQTIYIQIQRGYSAQFSGFKLATCTFLLSIYLSHKHCAFTITYIQIPPVFSLAYPFINYK